MKKSDKKVTGRNYFIVIVVSILIMVVVLYARTFYLNYKNNKVNISIFDDQKINQINSDDFDYALSETSSEMILYVSYTGSSEIRNIEDRLYKEIEKKNLTEEERDEHILSKLLFWSTVILLVADVLLVILPAFGMQLLPVTILDFM